MGIKRIKEEPLQRRRKGDKIRDYKESLRKVNYTTKKKSFQKPFLDYEREREASGRRESIKAFWAAVKAS